MKYLIKFNESMSDRTLQWLVRDIISTLEYEEKVEFRTITDSIHHQFWAYKYFNRAIGLKVVKSKPKNGNILTRSIDHMVLYFLDMDIENVESIYKKNKLGRDDGIYIPLNNRHKDDIIEDITIAIEQLKDYIDLE